MLADAGATRKVIRDALADRNISLGYRKFFGRPDERADVEYRRSANNAVSETEKRKSVAVVSEGGHEAGVFDARWLLAEEFLPIR